MVFLEIWIGSTDSALTAQIGSRLSALAQVLRRQGNYLLVSLDDGKSNAAALALTALIMEELFSQVLISSLKDTAPELSAEEQKTVLKRALSLLRKSGTLAGICRSISQRIAELFRESAVLTLEGILFFRCRDLLPLCEKYLSCALSEHRSARLLSALRQFVQKTPPKLPYLRVEERGSRFLLFDEHDRRIVPSFHQKYTPEEALLNGLLCLSPALLDLRGLKDPSLRAILEEIFSDRINRL